MTTPAEGNASSQHCDLAYLVESMAGNQSMAQKLANMFLDMYPATLESFDTAFGQADWLALRRVVHQLRGSCAIFSATTCVALAGKLENALPEHGGPDLREDCARFKEELALVASELRRFLDRSGRHREDAA